MFRKWLKSCLVVICGIVIPALLIIGISDDTFAKEVRVNVSTTTFDRSIMQGVLNCYNKHAAVRDNFGTLSEYKGLSSLLEDNNGNKTKGAQEKINLINNVASSRASTGDDFFGSSKSSMTCYDLFVGGKGTRGRNLITLMGKGNPPSGTEKSGVAISDFLSNMGYSTEKSGDGKCGALHYDYILSAAQVSNSTNGICISDDGSTLRDNGGSENKNMPGTAFISIKEGGKEACLNFVYIPKTSQSTTIDQKGCLSIEGKTFNDEWMKALVFKTCGSMDCKVDDAVGAIYRFDSSIGSSNIGGDAPSNYSAHIDNRRTAGLKAVSYLTDGSITNNDSVYLADGTYGNPNSIKIEGLEKRLLYQAYFTDFYGAVVDCREGQSNGAFEGKINWFDTSSMSMKKCHYNTSPAKEQKNKKVNGVNDSTGFLSRKINGLDELLSIIKDLPKNYSEEEIEIVGERVVNAGFEGGGGGDDTSTCASAGGAGSLGWIVCPVMEWLSNTAEGVYNDYVEPTLQVRPALFTASDETTRAWGIFRDMANIVFVIILLVVIFSQLTGLGIDNYGIKKILPKLIVMAILVNLSYLLCLLAVDVSNILGNGFQSLFRSMENGFGTNLQEYTIASSDGTMKSNPINPASVTGLTGVGILGMVSLGGVAIWGSPAILISMLASAVGVFVSIFFLFMLLAARQAAVIVMVVISPIAMVTYALPNTKKQIFDKWFGLFKGLLLVYPICGLLVGAGGYVSKLLISVGASGVDGSDFIWSFMAMIVSIVPIFFIPTVLKGAFAAMGKVGGMITGAGATASNMSRRFANTSGNAVAKRIGSTDTYRSARNAIGMRLPFRGSRARAVQDAIALEKERTDRMKYSDRDTMGIRIDSATAAMKAKAEDEAIEQRLSLMQTRGIGGKSFTVQNGEERLKALERASREGGLDDEQKLELAALTRGMAGKTGGAGAIAKVIRNAQSNDGGVNTSFMSTMGDIYTKDGTVQKKLNEKDAGASAYTEQFMNGGTSNENFNSFKTNYREENPNDPNNPYNYQTGIIDRRMKKYENGLDQSGAALEEYVNGLSANDIDNIKKDTRLYSSLDNSARALIDKRSENLTSPRGDAG